MDYVTILRKDRAAAPELAIPTPGEADRTAVLALLDAHGLARDDG